MRTEANRLAEYAYDPVTQTSTLLREYIWLDGLPIGVVESGALYYVRTDHIGRPIYATDNTGAKIWEVSYLPFGSVETSTGTPMELRFPGQWYQSESGLYQNWMRDYDPTTGRYIQADPLGLVAGPSVYGYAMQNPNRYIDPKGENPVAAMCATPLGAQVCRKALISVAKVCVEGVKIVAGATAGLFASSSEACGCEDDCPSPAEATKLARKKGSELERAFKVSGIGQGAGRSGGHGTPAKRAGAELIRLGNMQKCATLREAYKKEGKRRIKQGKGTNHP